jgi:hypothetical protein
MDTPSLNEEDIHTIGNMKIKKQAYADLGECIVTDQVAPQKVALYFKDKDFLRWYQKKYWKKTASEELQDELEPITSPMSDE